MAIKVDASKTTLNTYDRETQFDIESLVRSKHKKEKKHYPGGYCSAKFAHNHLDQAFLQTAHLQQDNTPSSTGQNGETFSHLNRTALFSRSGSVSKLEGGHPPGAKVISEVKKDDQQKTPQTAARPELDNKQNRLHLSAEGRAGTATGSSNSKLTAGPVHLISREDKQQLQSGETAPVLEQQFGSQEAKAAEAEQPTGPATTYISDALQVKDTDSINIEYRFSRWQGDHSVTLTMTAGTVQPDALLMYPSSQRVMETLNAHTGDWKGDKSLIVQNSDEDASQNQSGRQQQNDEDEA